MDSNLDSKRGVLSSMIIGVCLAVVFAGQPAVAQTQPVLSLNTNYMDPIYDPMSFGRGPVTFKFFVSASAAASFDTILNATLPPGVNFVSTSLGTATVSGNPAAGEQVAVALGQVYGTIYDYAFTIAIGQSPPDGALLGISFQLTGHGSNSSTQQVSNLIAYQVQAGYVPVGVFLANYNANCRASTRLKSSFNQSTDGTAVWVEARDESLAFGSAGTSGIPINPSDGPARVGDITATGVLALPSIGYSARAGGGAFLYVNDGQISAQPASGASYCSQSANVQFANPNPYAVPLIMDRRLNAFSAAGNEKARDPISGVNFGFRGNAEFGGGNFVRSGDGVATNRYSDRSLYVPGGNTHRIQKTITCFAEVQDVCDANPPSDVTGPFTTPNSGPFRKDGGLLIPAYTTDFDLNPVGNEDVDASGDTKIAKYPDLTVSEIRSGYGVISAESSAFLMRGDADVERAAAGALATMQIQGLSPIEVTVTNGDAKRVGFLPAPTPPLSVVTTRPAVLAEIFGASYSGIDSHPQTITIPDPKAGSFQIQATGTGDGPFTIVVETLDIRDHTIHQISMSGGAFPGSSDTFIVNLGSKGELSRPGQPGDTVPPDATATLAPPPNAAGWNSAAVSVIVDAIDDDGGSGVKQITYSATGAQSLDSTTVAGAKAVIGVAAEGQTAVSFFATDNAGNQETSSLLTVQIDMTPPTVVVNLTPPPNANGWNNAPVMAHFAAFDALSGVAGTTADDVTFSSDGANQQAARTFVDMAGNSVTAQIDHVDIDQTPPTVVVTRTPLPNANGWNNTPVTAHFAATDALSGVAGTTADDVTFSSDGANQQAARTFVDMAGNSFTAQIDHVNIDQTPPTVVVTRTPLPNANGWNNTPVTAHFAATDALSGIGGTTAADVTLSSDGANQQVSRTFVDIAGNSVTALIDHVNIDMTPPMVTCAASPSVLWPPNGRLVPIAVAVNVDDAGSGAAGFVLTDVTSDEPDGSAIQGFAVGTPGVSGMLAASRLGNGHGRTYTLTYTGYDAAGNSRMCQTTVRVPHDQSARK